ncbi:MAG: hypothetical protein KGS48_02785 [Bacteroidetes bacterium]|nr:hypothetical protein [Bacteroidota bacterium]
MKKFSIFILLCIWQQMAFAQIDTSRSPYGTYRFEGDDVVFTFDVRDYETAMRNSDSSQVDFADLKILDVAVQGNFNKWSARGWHMKRIDAYRFELSKPAKAFKDAPNWQFRFVINGTYWTDPQRHYNKAGMLGWYNILNPNAPNPKENDRGNAYFYLNGFENAQSVILAGSFNSWDEHALKMKKTARGWHIRLELQPGAYQYKFIVDGVWMHDPENPVRQLNEYNTFNSVLVISQTVHFQLNGFPEAKQVFLTGSFGNWNPQAVPMQKNDTGWFCDWPLKPGKHHYKFVVDGQWMVDPANKRKEKDQQGNENSIILVQ